MTTISKSGMANALHRENQRLASRPKTESANHQVFTPRMPSRPASNTGGSSGVVKASSQDNNVRGRDDESRERDTYSHVEAHAEGRQHQSGGGKDDQEDSNQFTTQCSSEISASLMSEGGLDLDFLSEKLVPMSDQEGIFELLLPDNEKLGVVVQHNKNGIHLILSTKNPKFEKKLKDKEGELEERLKSRLGEVTLTVL